MQHSRADPAVGCSSRRLTWKDFKALHQILPSADQQFHLVANSLAKLLETARRELEHDREAAKASLATASHILQAEIERCSGANGSTRGGLAAWQIASRASLHRQQLTPHHSHPGSQRGRASNPGALLAEVQTGCRRIATCLRGEKASGESLPSDDDQCGTTERNSLERWIFGSGTSMQTLQTGLWSKSGPLAARARESLARSLENRHRREYPTSDQHTKGLSFGPFECVNPEGTRLFLALRPPKLSRSSTEHMTEMTR